MHRTQDHYHQNPFGWCASISVSWSDSEVFTAKGELWWTTLKSPLNTEDRALEHLCLLAKKLKGTEPQSNQGHFCIERKWSSWMRNRGKAFRLIYKSSLFIYLRPWGQITFKRSCKHLSRGTQENGNLLLKCDEKLKSSLAKTQLCSARSQALLCWMDAFLQKGKLQAYTERPGQSLLASQ